MDIRKLPEGDWMQKKYQQRAENNWHANAELLAEQLRELATRYQPRVAPLRGDVRACTDLAGILGQVPQRDVAVVDSGGRAEGISEAAHVHAVRRMLAPSETSDNRLIRREE